MLSHTDVPRIFSFQPSSKHIWPGAHFRVKKLGEKLCLRGRNRHSTPGALLMEAIQRLIATAACRFLSTTSTQIKKCYHNLCTALNNDMTVPPQLQELLWRVEASRQLTRKRCISLPLRLMNIVHLDFTHLLRASHHFSSEAHAS
jgi:hypothetical protein